MHSLNLKRLWLLTGRHWFENRKTYLLFFLALAAFLFGWFSFVLSIVQQARLLNPANQVTMYFLGLFLSGCLSASFLFHDFSSKSRTINYLMIPASALEKLICILFYGVILFFIGYNVVFYIADFLSLKVAGTIYTPEWQNAHGFSNHLSFRQANTFALDPDMYVFYPGDNIDLYTAFFPIQSCFLLGAFYFKKNGMIKTLIVLLLIWLVFVVLESRILFSSIPPNSRVVNAFTAYIMPQADGYDNIVTLPEWMYHTVLFVTRFAITPAIWLATYFRLKEKEL